jgi:hypothetical protein
VILAMELLGLVALLAVCGLVLIGLLKLLVWVLILPVKIGFWLVKGFFGLLLLAPLFILWVCAASIVPVVFGLLVLPVLAVVLGVIVLARAVF